MSDVVYLDHAAATPLADACVAAMDAARSAAFANPSSAHAAGRRARALLESARERILAAGGAAAGDRLVFTSGATEANRIALLGQPDPPGICGWSHRDHPSVRGAAAALAAAGWRLVEMPLDGHGRVAGGPPAGATLVTVTLACGQSGSRESPETLAAWKDLPGPPRIHVDATQAVAHDPTPWSALPADTVALAPAKFGGPRGIGGLLVRRGLPVEPSGHVVQEFGLRGGTEAVLLAVGFAAALEATVADRSAEAARVAALRERFERRLAAEAAGHGVRVVVVAADVPRCPHIATLALVGIDRQAFVMAADLAGVACATGTACASGSSEPAPALVAAGLDPTLVRSAVRFSFGRTTTTADVDEAVARIGTLWTRLPREGRTP